ncbi:MAG: hypothetical protein OXI75_03935 [Rhodospirillales bacterium]|nr:hypothetical protein [Rhodospirillales bacterium]
MTEAQRRLREIEDRRSKANQKMAELARGDWTDETRAEYDQLEATIPDVEREAREAARAVEIEDRESRVSDPSDNGLKPEERERLELRGRARFGKYIAAALQGRKVDGAEAEFSAAHKVPAGSIPLDLFESDRPEVRNGERRDDAATTIPTSGLGATLAPIQPFIFSESIAPRLGIAMPSVGSGSYSEATITTSLTAGAKAKGAAQDSTAAVITPTTANPRRISSRLTTQIEDVAQIGVGNYEAALRMNAVAKLSDEYDRQCISGDGSAPNVNGLINQLTDPTNPTDVANFDAFVASFVDQVDGLWAMTGKDVAIVTNPDAWKLSAKTFRDIATADLGSVAFSDYAMEHFGGWWCNSRMPASASDIARGIVYRKARTGLRTASHPTWGSMSVSDVYSDAASGQTHFTLHVLVGDKLLLVQSAAYGLVEYKTA